MKDENLYVPQRFIFHLSSFILSMNRSFSLRTAEFQRVWDDGKSWSHPLVILRTCTNGMERCRFGFVAGKKVGKATVRNRVKRLLGEAVRRRLPTIAPGWDMIVIARSGTARATFQDIDTAIANLLQRAKLEIEKPGFSNQ